MCYDLFRLITNEFGSFDNKESHIVSNLFHEFIAHQQKFSSDLHQRKHNNIESQLKIDSDIINCPKIICDYILNEIFNEEVIKST